MIAENNTADAARLREALVLCQARLAMLVEETGTTMGAVTQALAELGRVDPARYHRLIEQAELWVAVADCGRADVIRQH